MVLPVDIDQSHQNDPLIILPLPSPLPKSPLPALSGLMKQFDFVLDGTAGPSSLHTSRMRQINRDAYALMNAGRVEAAEARAELDRRDTVLRGVEYERNRIRQEIERCMEYVPAYTDAELPSVEAFLASAPNEVKTALPNSESEEYEYAIIVAQLEQELKDIQAREADVETLTRDRDNLVRAKKEMKRKFANTETYLTEYTKSTSMLLSRLNFSVDSPTLSALTTSAIQAPVPEDDQMDTA